jgi:hypothetical protein
MRACECARACVSKVPLLHKSIIVRCRSMVFDCPCLTTFTTITQVSKHRRVPLAERPLKESKCKIHPQQTLILYCRNEKVVICEHCHKYGDHQKHDAILLQDLGLCLLHPYFSVVCLQLWFLEPVFVSVALIIFHGVCTYTCNLSSLFVICFSHLFLTHFSYRIYSFVWCYSGCALAIVQATASFAR